MTDHAKDFIKCIEHFRYRHHAREVFRDWAELIAAMLHNKPYHDFGWQTDPTFDRVEATYLEVAKRYEGEDFDVFARMMGLTYMALQEQKQDFLGRCYMQLEINNKSLAQEFTPYEMSLLMARLSLCDVGGIIDRLGFFALHEPACGAGSTIIAAAQIVEDGQRDPTAVMWFEAWDIDRLCANMTYIQCSLLGLSGIVRHGDTLRLKTFDWRLTPAAAVNYERTQRMYDYTCGKWEPAEKLPATGLVQMPIFAELV